MAEFKTEVTAFHSVAHSSYSRMPTKEHPNNKKNVYRKSSKYSHYKVYYRTLFLASRRQFSLQEPPKNDASSLHYLSLQCFKVHWQIYCPSQTRKMNLKNGLEKKVRGHKHTHPQWYLSRISLHTFFL